MKVKCPKCRREVPADAINIKHAVAYCVACEELIPLGTHTPDADEGQAPAAHPPETPSAPRVTRSDLDAPPGGAWFEDTGDGCSFAATTRSAVAFFLVPFMAIWSGGSMGGIYGLQIAEGRFDLMRSLFGLPFLFGTVILGSITLMTLCGRVQVAISGAEATIFTGVFGIGWTKHADLDSIDTIEEGYAGYNTNNRPQTAILLTGSNSTVKFGSMLSKTRREYLLRCMQYAWLQRKRLS